MFCGGVLRGGEVRKSEEEEEEEEEGEWGQ